VDREEREMTLSKKMAVILLVLVLIGTFGFGCGKENEPRITITIGEINDLTGVASGATVSLHYAIQDIVRYYNDEGLIPGVRLRLVSWDDQWNPSRDLPGYDWLKAKGAKLIISVPGPAGIGLKAFADRDKFPIASLTTAPPMLQPPGWVFAFSNSMGAGGKTMLKWLSENNWDYAKGTPKIGLVGYDESTSQEVAAALMQYSQAHPDKFDYVGGFLVPFGTVLFSGVVEKLKGCDYVWAWGTAAATFIKQFWDRGYRTAFFDYSSLGGYREYLADMCGWEAIDGLLMGSPSLGWDQSTPIVNLARDLLRRYRPSEAQSIVDKGTNYPGVFQQLVSIFGIVEKAIGEVGAGNFDSQAFYDAALEYTTGGAMWQGYPQWGFSDTKRYLVDDITVYEFSAQAKDLLRISDWVPLEVD
jgi:hypothetical protein